MAMCASRVRGPACALLAAALLALAGGALAPPSADGAAPLDAACAEMQAEAAAFDGRIGFVVVDLTGWTRCAHDGGEVFMTASLYKLIVAAEAYRQREAGELSFDEQLLVLPIGEYNHGQTFTTTVGEAVQLAVQISHNDAARALRMRLGRASVRAAPERLGLPDTVLAEEYTTTPSDIASLLVRLHGGRLVGPGADGELVDLLLGQTVVDRIPRGLPAGVPVAHKTGRLNPFAHDAGIVYAPGGPYVLAVLTEGAESEHQGFEVIRSLAALSWPPFAEPRPRSLAYAGLHEIHAALEPAAPAVGSAAPAGDAAAAPLTAAALPTALQQPDPPAAPPPGAPPGTPAAAQPPAAAPPGADAAAARTGAAAAPAPAAAVARAPAAAAGAGGRGGAPPGALAALEGAEAADWWTGYGGIGFLAAFVLLAWLMRPAAPAFADGPPRGPRRLRSAILRGRAGRGARAGGPAHDPGGRLPGPGGRTAEMKFRGSRNPGDPEADGDPGETGRERGIAPRFALAGGGEPEDVEPTPRLQRLAGYFRAQRELLDGMHGELEAETAPLLALLRRQSETVRQVLVSLDARLAPLHAYGESEEANLETLQQRIDGEGMDFIARAFSDYVNRQSQRISEIRNRIDAQREPIERLAHDLRESVELALARFDSDIEALETNLAEQRRVLSRLRDGMRSDEFGAVAGFLEARQLALAEAANVGVADPAEIGARLQVARDTRTDSADGNEYLGDLIERVTETDARLRRSDEQPALRALAPPSADGEPADGGADADGGGADAQPRASSG